MLDGKRYAIAGLNISNGNGMFIRTGTGCVIRNLGFVGPAMDTGDEHGDMSNVYIVGATLTGEYGLGLIASTHSAEQRRPAWTCYTFLELPTISNRQNQEAL